MAHVIRNAVLAAGLTATTALSVPASAATPVPQAFAASRFDPQTVSAEHYCRWNCGGWGGGWGGRGWRRDRIDAGDVILGAVLIGGVAAIASSALRRDRDRDEVVYERDPYRRDGDWVRRDDPRSRPVRTAATSGLDNAASLCVSEVERNARVAAVDNVRRDASGWEVTGTLARGEGFRCRIGNDGRIGAIDYDGLAAGSAGGGQWSDEAYTAARASLGGTVRPDMAVQETTVTRSAGAATSASRQIDTTRMPAYPGGPIPGEEIPENAPEPLPGG